jgi:competence protein ComEC
VRLSVKRGTAPAPGSFVEVKASLEPPLQPLEPGSYDFARDRSSRASARPVLSAAR